MHIGKRWLEAGCCGAGAYRRVPPCKLHRQRLSSLPAVHHRSVQAPSAAAFCPRSIIASSAKSGCWSMLLINSDADPECSSFSSCSSASGEGAVAGTQPAAHASSDMPSHLPVPTLLLSCAPSHAPGLLFMSSTARERVKLAPARAAPQHTATASDRVSAHEPEQRFLLSMHEPAGRFCMHRCLFTGGGLAGYSRAQRAGLSSLGRA